MYAGFSRQVITPPVRTPMQGWTARDLDHGAEGVHDDLFVRALYLRHEDEEALILAYDVVFFAREHADRLKAAVGREFDLLPRQILINTSHTHCGPAVSYYGHQYPLLPDWPYLQMIEAQTRQAVLDAKTTARPVTMHAGAARTQLPVSRRMPDGRGGIAWAPYPEGVVCDHLPVCLLKDAGGQPVCLLFSVSCHPSTWYAWQFTAEYPGVACDRLDAHLGAACSLFLQGMAGDTKACVIADGGDAEHPAWRGGTWEDVQQAGTLVADEVITALNAGFNPVTPAVHTALIEQSFPLAPLPAREVFEAAAGESDMLRKYWGERQLALLDRDLPLAETAEILVQGIQLGDGLRLVALEGEPVAGLGLQILHRYPGGTTFPLGFSNGMGLYLPTSQMLSEGGYEVESYYEYGYPAPLADGIDKHLDLALDTLRNHGTIG